MHIINSLMNDLLLFSSLFFNTLFCIRAHQCAFDVSMRAFALRPETMWYSIEIEGGAKGTSRNQWPIVFIPVIEPLNYTLTANKSSSSSSSYRVCV